MPPLDGLKVVDLTRVLAGPFCAMLLGDMGADVIKVEEPRLGDDARGWAPNIGDWSRVLSRRQSQQAKPDARSQEPRVCGRAARSFSPVPTCSSRTSSRAASTGWASGGTRCTRSIRASSTAPSPGYGRTGPRRHLSGYDPVVQAESGFMDLTGTADGPPVRTGIATSDYLAGLYAFGGILLALRDRDRRGARPARGHRAFRFRALDALDAGRRPAGDGQESATHGQRSRRHRAVRDVQRARRHADDRRGKSAALEAVVRGRGRGAPRRGSPLPHEHRSRAQPAGAQAGAGAGHSRRSASTSWSIA